MTFAELARSARADLGALVSGRAHVSAELRDIHERAIALVEGRGDVRDAVAQGALSTLLLGRLREGFVAHWLETGPGFATACAAHERRYVAAHLRRNGALDLKVRFLAVRAPEQIAIALDVPTWQTLAPAFKKLKKADRSAAQAEVRMARADLPLPLAAYIDGIALLSSEAARDVLAIARDAAQWDALFAQLVTMFPALALEPTDETRAAAKAILATQRAGLVNFIGPYAKAITDAMTEEDAAAALARILRDAHADGTADASEAKKVARALAGLSSPLAEEFFATHVTSRLVGDVAADYVAAKPARASDAAYKIATAVHAKHEEQRQERSRRAKKVARVRKSEATVARVMDDAPVADADASTIPWLLRDPPWRGGIAPFPRALFEPPAFEERVHWTEEEGREADEDDPVRALASSSDAASTSRAIDQALALGDEGFQALRRVESPRVAAAMLGALGTKRAPLAMRYFVDYPEATTIGLAGMLMRAEGDARVLLQMLAHVAREGQERAIVTTLEQCGPEMARGAGELVFAARLMDCPNDAPVVPLYAQPAKLPMLLLRDGTKLPPGPARNLVEMLAFSEAKRPYAGARLVREALDRVALDRFLVAVDEASREVGASDDWPMLALSLLGGPDAMRAAVKQIKEWNRSSQARDLALDAIDSMVNGGRDAAAALTELVRKGTGGLLGERASYVLRVIAKREGLSEDALADMSTPSLELEADGTVTLDFGARKLRVVLADDLSAAVIDEQGAKVSAVRATKTDDPVKAQASVDRFKSLKKALGETARAAAGRLEQSMVLAREFEGRAFGPYVAHPILGRLARRFVWARIDKKTSGVAETFRVSEDGTFANTNDDRVTLDEAERVRIVHPMEVGAQTLARWADIFADYEIIQPFPQLGRTLYAPTREELVANELTRFRDRDATQMGIMGRLTTRGWEKVGGACITGYVKRLRGVSAQLVLADEMMSGPGFVNETKMGIASFGMPLGKVPPIAFSEIAYDLDVFDH